MAEWQYKSSSGFPSLKTPLSGEERETRMRSMLVDASKFGTVTPLGPFQAQLVVPARKTNHVLHLLLTLVTAGIWLIVWIVLAAQQQAEERHIISVDEHGGLWVDGESRPRGLGQR